MYVRVCGCTGAGVYLRARSLIYPACTAHTPYFTASQAHSRFSTLSHKRQDFRNKILLDLKLLWFSLQILSEAFVILRKIQQDMIMYVKCPLFLSDFGVTWIFWTHFRKIRRCLNLMKIRPVGADLFCVEKDVTKLMVTFRSFANAPVECVVAAKTLETSAGYKRRKWCKNKCKPVSIINHLREVRSGLFCG